MFPTRDFKSRLLEYDTRAINWYRLHYRLPWKKDLYPQRAFYWVTFLLWLCVFPLLSCTATSLITIMQTCIMSEVVESSWNVMAYGDAREGKWRGNWRREWVASTRHTTSEHGVSSITTADAHTSAASSRLNWRPRRFKWTRPFRRKTKCDFCACAITFPTQSNYCTIFAADTSCQNEFIFFTHVISEVNESLTLTSP